MVKYRFRIGDTDGLWAVFHVVANSRDQAVELANTALEERQEASSLFIGSPVREAYACLEPSVKVDTSMIIEEIPFEISELKRVCEWLDTQGFDYQDPDHLAEDEEPIFTKPMYTEDGEGIYAFIQVRAHWDLNIEAYSYRIEAILYPVGLARKVEGDTKLIYGVQFQDKQAYTTADELPEILQAYEVKFRKLITVLRDADPVDGLPNMIPGGFGE